MKLKSVQIFPNGINGLETDELIFGDNITQLLGPNGCGKTPIIQSIAFCLGYPSVFRNEIYEKCNHVILNIEINNRIFKIKRIFSRDVDIKVDDCSGSTHRFFSEKEYSKYIFECIGFKVSNLVSTKKAITTPYLSTVLPFFYVDQDDGYAGIYCPPKKFILDQFSEMVRVIFELPVKNSFDEKKERLAAKERLEYLDKSVKEQSRRVELARSSISNFSKNSDELAAEILRLELELEDLKREGASQDDSTSSLDRLISMHKKNYHAIESELNELYIRRRSVEKIIEEINTEINTLNLNEEARRVFLSFGEICGSKRCQLFSASSDSYGKNLLYLKDQLKDLERNDSVDQVMVDKLTQEKNNLQNRILELVTERNNIIEKSEIASIVNAVSELKNEIFSLQGNLDCIKEYEVVSKKYSSVIIERDKALEYYDSFGSSRSLSPDIIRFRSDLRQCFLNWIDNLRTTNVSKDITFADDFAPVLGREIVSQLKGSTRVRTVLAFHAAILELAAKSNSAFKFLILDTPKQHEIHNDDLDRYFKELKMLCKKFSIQIVFSTTEYEYFGDVDDMQWTPQYLGVEQKMFMRKLEEYDI